MEHAYRTVFLAAMLVLSTTFPALAQQDVDVRDLAQNPAGHHGKVITVEGTIAGYQTRVTARGTPYASFRLKEGDASVMVFAGRPQGTQECPARSGHRQVYEGQAGGT